MGYTNIFQLSTITVALLFSFLSVSHRVECQDNSSVKNDRSTKRKKESKHKMDTPSKKLGVKGYVPKNLKECFIQLEVQYPPEEIKKLVDEPETKLYKFHHGLGRWIRNNWGLWDTKSDLYKHLNKLGLKHPDDMSSTILKTFWRHKHGEPLNVEKEVEYYKAYWEKMKKQSEK